MSWPTITAFCKTNFLQFHGLGDEDVTSICMRITYDPDNTSFKFFLLHCSIFWVSNSFVFKRRLFYWQIGNHSHINCCCPRQKIHSLELDFISSQRTKVGGQGSMQKVSTDYKEGDRFQMKKKRPYQREEWKKEKEEWSHAKGRQHCHDVYQLFDGSPEEKEVKSDGNSKEPSKAISKRENMMQEVFLCLLFHGRISETKVIGWSRCNFQRIYWFN